MFAQTECTVLSIFPKPIPQLINKSFDSHYQHSVFIFSPFLGIISLKQPYVSAFFSSSAIYRERSSPSRPHRGSSAEIGELNPCPLRDCPER